MGVIATVGVIPSLPRTGEGDQSQTGGGAPAPFAEAGPPEGWMDGESLYSVADGLIEAQSSAGVILQNVVKHPVQVGFGRSAPNNFHALLLALILASNRCMT